MMKPQSLLRFFATLLIFALAITLGYALWKHYMYLPWTRDGRVRAEVVTVAPDVSGLVTRVLVQDNQFVRKGDLLFQIDQERFRLALAQAEAQVVTRKAELDMRRQQAFRRAKLEDSVLSAESREDSSSQAAQALGNYQAAVAARDTAKLNLQRSEIVAPVDGYVTNLNLYAGNYASAGTARMAIIDKNSYWVYGYFEETKLPNVRVGDKVEVRLLSGETTLKGHVESIARGITDRDNPSGPNLLADVNPVFTWVRLAQRVPVRVHLDHIPDGLALAMGTTCTVSILPSEH